MGYSASSFTAGQQPTTAQWNVLWSNDASFNDGSGFAPGALGSDNASLATGIVRQVVSTNFSAVATGTTVIPLDDTIPQITEGTEFMTQAITPKSATNILLIEALFFGSHSTIATTMTVALFQDATANALAASGTLSAPTATGTVNIKLQHVMTAGTTSSTTFRIRAGGDSGTITFNGQSGARRYGGITLSSIKITEYKA